MSSNAFLFCSFEKPTCKQNGEKRRVRDTLVKGKDELPATKSEIDSAVVQASNVEVLNLMSNLGEDDKQSDGKFRFIVYNHIVPFFLFLRMLVESLMTPTTIVAPKDTGLSFYYSFYIEFSGCFQNSRNHGNTMNFILFVSTVITADTLVVV